MGEAVPSSTRFCFVLIFFIGMEGNDAASLASTLYSFVIIGMGGDGASPFGGFWLVGVDSSALAVDRSTFCPFSLDELE